DVDLVRRLNKIGKFKLVRARVRTSARRYDRNGIVYTTVRNWSLIIRYLLGQSPERLHRLYSDAR
ncbi:MAG: glycosyl transferase, partial [Desulfobacteraceae bacterium]